MTSRPIDKRALYARYRDAVSDEPLPLALVDLDAVDRNTEALLRPVRAAQKTLRIASKSIRCLELLRHIVERGAGAIRGVMAYAAKEAELLVQHGFEDVLVAYPTIAKADLEALVRANQRAATVSIAVDSVPHVEALDAAATRSGVRLPVVIDADVSYRPLGQVHIGVRRSPLRSAASIVELARQIEARRGLKLLGVLAYEAQIAGVADGSATLRLMKSRSRPDVKRIREEIARGLRSAGIEIALFNGGGTGSLRSASEEAVLTEVTAGSGFVASHLFDHYRDVDLEPALLFALQVVRRSDPEIATCHGGGYIASGQAGVDRLPQPYLPEGLALLPLEGAGEVQTPISLPSRVDLPIGAPVFWRHAKAGELAEHFNEYLFVRGRSIVDRVKTYRGAGHCFL